MFVSPFSNTKKYHLRYFWVYRWVESANRHVHLVKGDVNSGPFCWSNKFELVIYARVGLIRCHQGRIFSIIPTSLRKNTIFFMRFGVISNNLLPWKKVQRNHPKVQFQFQFDMKQSHLCFRLIVFPKSSNCWRRSWWHYRWKHHPLHYHSMHTIWTCPYLQNYLCQEVYHFQV